MRSGLYWAAITLVVVYVVNVVLGVVFGYSLGGLRPFLFTLPPLVAFIIGAATQHRPR